MCRFCTFPLSPIPHWFILGQGSSYLSPPIPGGGPSLIVTWKLAWEDRKSASDRIKNGSQSIKVNESDTSGRRRVHRGKSLPLVSSSSDNRCSFPFVLAVSRFTSRLRLRKRLKWTDDQAVYTCRSQVSVLPGNIHDAITLHVACELL